MRLHLERDGPTVADVHDTRVLADAGQHARAHLVSRGLAEVAQVHLGRLVGAVLAPHHRVHRQLGAGGPAAEDLANPLVLVVLEAQLVERLRLVGGGVRMFDGVHHVGPRARSGDSHAQQSKELTAAEQSGTCGVGRIEQFDGQFGERDIERSPKGRQGGEHRQALAAAGIAFKRNEQRGVIRGGPPFLAQR